MENFVANEDSAGSIPVTCSNVNPTEDIRRDLTNIYPRIRKRAIDYLTDHEFGMAGPVSNTKLRKWGYYAIKRAKIEGRM